MGREKPADPVFFDEVEALLGTPEYIREYQREGWTGMNRRRLCWSIWYHEHHHGLSREAAIERAESLWGVDPYGWRDYPPHEDLATWCPSWDGE